VSLYLEDFPDVKLLFMKKLRWRLTMGSPSAPKIYHPYARERGMIIDEQICTMSSNLLDGSKNILTQAQKIQES